MATQYKVLVGDTATPEIRVPKTGDESYLAPVTLDAATGNESAFLILSSAMLVACQTPPNYETGEFCDYYGVELENTGRMVAEHPLEIPVYRVGYEDLWTLCDVQPPHDTTWSLRGCLVPRPVDGKEGTAKIYVYKMDDPTFTVRHERCHALLGRNHTPCGPTAYGNCYWN